MFRGACFEPHQPFLLYDFATGGTLHAYLQQHTDLSDYRKIELLAQAARGLCSLHDLFVLHRDITSRNYLLSKDGKLKLSDFSHSVELQPDQQTITAHGGPLAWMAPEALEPANVSSYKTDVYMFGSLMYEVYAGKDPYDGEEDMNQASNLIKVVQEQFRRPAISPSWPEGVKHLIKSCWERDQSNRPSMREVYTKLTELQKSLKVEVRDEEKAGTEESLAKELEEERMKRAKAEAEVVLLKGDLARAEEEIARLRKKLEENSGGP